MKKLYSLLFVIVALMMPIDTWAVLAVGDTFTVDGMNFQVTSISPNEVQVGTDTGTYLAIDQNTEGTVNIPATVIGSDGNSYAVTAIRQSAFNHCEKITGVTIPEGITSIGRIAFYACYNITSVTIPSTVTTIGERAFESCKNLSTVIIKEGVTTICEGAFNRLANLTSVTIPSTVTNIGKQAFYECTNLANIVLPEGLTTIEDAVFAKCTSLTSINIPSTVTSIGPEAFGSCSALAAVHITDMKAWCGIEFGNNQGANPFFVAQHLYLNGNEVKDLVIPEGTTKIGKYAFYNCNSLTSVTIPAGITDFGKEVFERCDGLTSVTSASSLGERAFYWCNNITNVTLLEGVTTIGKEALFGLTSDGGSTSLSSLSTITIPSSLKSIGKSAFSNCKALTAVHIKDLASWCGIEFDGEKCNPLTFAHHLFMNGNELTNLNIPEGVTAIKQYAFNGGEGLTSVTIPSSMSSIEKDAFKDCSGLTAVHIKDVAAWCGIEFVRNNNAKTSNPLLLAHHLYLNGNEVTDLVIPEGVNEIKDNVFTNCEGLTNVTISEGVTSIGLQAFQGCSNLASVSIPKSLTNIGANAFNACTGLTAVHLIDIAAWCAIPFKQNSVDNPLKIAGHLFMNGQEVKDLVIPEGVASISYGAFNGCKFNSVSIPSSLTTISDYAFNSVEANTVYIKDLAAWCKIQFGSEWASNPLVGAQHLFVNGEEVTDLVIPDGVTKINANAFYYCEALTSVNTGNSTKIIGGRAFCGCSKLNSVTIGSAVESIYDRAFFHCIELKSVISQIEYPFEIPEYTFINNIDGTLTVTYATLYVPSGTKAKYEATKGWNMFREITEAKYIDPIEGETSVNTNELGNEDLTDNVVNGVYYNLGGDNSGYDSTDGSIVIGETTNMGQITNPMPGTSDVANNFTGIILKVAAGKGTITVNVKTTGNAQLVVQIGNGTPMIASKTEQGDVIVNYDVTEDTYIYIYAIIGSSSAPSQRVASDNAVKIYGITVTPGATGIQSIGNELLTIDNYYTLDGRKIEGVPMKKGLYIVNGRKVVIK